MKNYKKNCGIAKNIFSLAELEHAIKIFQKFDTTPATGAVCAGVDNNHAGYLWFEKKILNKIKPIFNPDLKLIFGMLLDCTKPFDIHHDLKPLPEKGGKHYLTFLIPYSVNNQVELCGHASTLIFNECCEELNKMPDLDNNISNIFDSKISHVDKKRLTKYSLKLEAVWNLGDIIWWDSSLAHVSNDFHKRGFDSKQCIVLHTYVL
jgi:hypothetical protein